MQISQIRGGDRSWPIQQLRPSDILAEEGQWINEGRVFLGVLGAAPRRDAGTMELVRAESHECEDSEQTGTPEGHPPPDRPSHPLSWLVGTRMQGLRPTTATSTPRASVMTSTPL